jgi:hypothetical protein
MLIGRNLKSEVGGLKSETLFTGALLKTFDLRLLTYQ